MKLCRRRMFRRKSLIKLFGLILLCYTCYLLGVFTHLLEKDFSEFHYSSHIDVNIAINEHAFKYIDINNHSYSFIYDSSSTCDQNVKPTPHLVILVKSKLSHFEQRNAIRETWGKINKSNQNLIRIVFLLGIPSPIEYPELQNDDDDNEHHQIDVTLKQNNIKQFPRLKEDGELDLNEKLKLENSIYNDIIQQNFYDTYYNNTLKAIMGLQWIDKYCSDATYFLFIDDDYYLNPKLLIKYLKLNVENNEVLFNNLYGGFVFENSSPMRHRFSKWFLSLQEYPYDKFPPYVSAGCYIMSKKSANLFYKATKLITSFRFDDIYLGILAYKLNIRPFNIDEIYFYPPDFYNIDNVEKIIASHGFTPNSLKDVWKIVTKLNNTTLNIIY